MDELTLSRSAQFVGRTGVGVTDCSAFFCLALSRLSWFLDLTLPLAFTPLTLSVPLWRATGAATAVAIMNARRREANAAQ